MQDKEKLEAYVTEVVTHSEFVAHVLSIDSRKEVVRIAAAGRAKSIRIPTFPLQTVRETRKSRTNYAEKALIPPRPDSTSGLQYRVCARQYRARRRARVAA
eukprot:204254-Rhodomonas_salina.2